MKNIFIIDEYISSQKNGIGTFLRELLYCFKNSGNKINLISFNAEVDEFCITEEKEIRKFLFPVFKYGHFLEHANIIEKFFRLYITDSSDNIFFINHSPCADFIESLKETHTQSTVIFTIHDFGWTGILLGNLDAYKKAIKQHQDNKIDDTPELKVYYQERRIYELTDKIICLSLDTYNILTTVYKVPKNKITFIPNGLRIRKTAKSLSNNERKKIRIQKNINDDDKILLFIGRPTVQKGIFQLIHAMKQVLKEFPGTKLVIIGDGNEVSMKEIVNTTSYIAVSTVITGHLNRAEVGEWLSIADIGIISSYYEQCPFSGIEMMMYGIPIIASDGIGIRNMFQNEVNARTVGIGNRKHPKEYQNNLANAIVELLKSPKLCSILSATARKTYEEKYHIRYMKQKYNKLIQSL